MVDDALKRNHACFPKLQQVGSAGHEGGACSRTLDQGVADFRSTNCTETRVNS